jgi:hypothetical protein
MEVEEDQTRVRGVSRGNSKFMRVKGGTAQLVVDKPQATGLEASLKEQERKESARREDRHGLEMKNRQSREGSISNGEKGLTINPVALNSRVSTEVVEVGGSLLDKHYLDFDEYEVTHFQKLSAYVIPNARKMKRLATLYGLVRSLIDVPKEKKKDPQIMRCKLMLMQWMLLCEQWPLRMSWLLELVEQEISPDEADEMDAVHRIAFKIEEVEGDRVNAKRKKRTNPDPDAALDNSKRPEVALHQMFAALVQPRLYDIENVQCVKPVRAKYAQLFLLDGDSKAFEKLLKERADGQRLTVADVVSFLGDVGLKQFTMNLSPAVRETLKEITAHRGHGVDCDDVDNDEFSTFSRRESRFRSTLKVTGRDRTSFQVRRKKSREVFVTVTSEIASSKLHKQLLAALGGIDKEQLLGWEASTQADPLLRQGDELELKIDNTPLVRQEDVTREGTACKVTWGKRKGSQVLRYEVKLTAKIHETKEEIVAAHFTEVVFELEIVAAHFKEVVFELAEKDTYQYEASVRAIDEEGNGEWSVPVPVPVPVPQCQCHTS